jgi:hypothetical protein
VATSTTKTDEPEFKDDQVEDEFASFDDLFSKPARYDTVKIASPDGKELKLRLQAIGSHEYDTLISKFPPNKEQRERGQMFNPDTFAPALMSACSVKPKLNVEQVTKIYQSDSWSSGELGAWFIACQRLCNAGLDIPFNDAG